MGLIIVVIVAAVGILAYFLYHLYKQHEKKVHRDDKDWHLKKSMEAAQKMQKAMDKIEKRNAKMGRSDEATKQLALKYARARENPDDINHHTTAEDD